MDQVKNFLVTGPPGVGKTTFITNLADKLADYNPSGFYTREIRESGSRKGFELVSLDGETGILSHTNIDSKYRVGKYRVDVEAFEEFLERIPFFEEKVKIVVMDEIGKMELFSNKFEAVVEKLLNSSKPFIATIALKGGGFIAEVKNRSDTEVFKLNSREDQEDLYPVLIERIKNIEK